jgi:hypothetical protein
MNWRCFEVMPPHLGAVERSLERSAGAGLTSKNISHQKQKQTIDSIEEAEGRVRWCAS